LEIYSEMNKAPNAYPTPHSSRDNVFIRDQGFVRFFHCQLQNGTPYVLETSTGNDSGCCRQREGRRWTDNPQRPRVSSATRSRLIYCRKATPSIRGNSIVISADGNVWVRKLTRQCGNPSSLELGQLLE